MGDRSNNKWVIHICPTTGGDFELTVPYTLTVEGLKHVIEKKLKLPMDKINLLFKERILKTGPLIRHGVSDGCKFTLLPNVESGLNSQKTDHSIMQVLENLTDKQVNEFLAGKAPLTLAMKLGDHMMFLQLQLSSSPFATRHAESQTSNHPHHYNNRHLNSTTQSVNQFQRQSNSHNNNVHQQHQRRHRHQSRNLTNFQTRKQYTPEEKYNLNKQPEIGEEMDTSEHRNSLSSTLSSTSPPSLTLGNLNQRSVFPELPQRSHSQYKFKSPPQPTRYTGDMPSSDTDDSLSISGSPPSSPNILSHRDCSSSSSVSYCSSSPQSSPPSSPVFLPPASPVSMATSSPQVPSRVTSVQKQHQHQQPKATPICTCKHCNDNLNLHHPVHHPNKAARQDALHLFDERTAPIIDEAKKTLQEKMLELRQMSNVANAGPTTSTTDVRVEENKETTSGSPGAVINSMHHVGKGVYSGTFSGTLNPALHDDEGKPKRNLSTIVHILNDLLGAAPQGKITPSALSQLERAQHHQQLQQQSSSKISSRRKGHFKSKDDDRRLDRETQIMKAKVKQVQMMLQQRRQKRRAKREARTSPYGWTKSTISPSQINRQKNPNSIDVNGTVETDINNDINGDDNSNFVGGELKPEAVLV